MKTIAQQLNIKKFPFSIKDDDGNQIYYENSDGDWYKSEYDSNGKLLYHKTSSGYWERREWDSNGNEIYYEDSAKGVKVDNRSKVVEIDGVKYKLTRI